MKKKIAILTHVVGMLYLMVILFISITTPTEAYFVDETVITEKIQIGYWEEVEKSNMDEKDEKVETEETEELGAIEGEDEQNHEKE